MMTLWFQTRMGSEVSILPTAQKTVDAGWVNIKVQGGHCKEILIGDLRATGGLKVIMETIEALIPQPSNAPTFITTIFIENPDGVLIGGEVMPNWYRRESTVQEITDALEGYRYIRSVVFKIGHKKFNRHGYNKWINTQWNNLCEGLREMSLVSDVEQRIGIFIAPIQGN